jgi:hypothetical protein
MPELLYGTGDRNMDLAIGLTVLAFSILVTLVVRAVLVRHFAGREKTIYRNIRISSVEGLNPGLMTYLVSLITVIIGPFSYRIYGVTQTSYLILNAVAGIFFSLTYPYFSPVTLLSTVDIFEKNGRKFCLVGRVINRKLEVVSMNEALTIEINVRCGKSLCRIIAINPSTLQRSS